MPDTRITFYTPSAISARCYQPGPSYIKDGHWHLEFHDEPNAPFSAAALRVAFSGPPTGLRGFVAELVAALALAELIDDKMADLIAGALDKLDEADADEADQAAYRRELAAAEAAEDVWSREEQVRRMVAALDAATSRRTALARELAEAWARADVRAAAAAADRVSESWTEFANDLRAIVRDFPEVQQ